MARDHLTDVDWKIADLRALHRELNDLLSQRQCGAIANCRL